DLTLGARPVSEKLRAPACSAPVTYYAHPGRRERFRRPDRRRWRQRRARGGRGPTAAPAAARRSRRGGAAANRSGVVGRGDQRRRPLVLPAIVRLAAPSGRRRGDLPERRRLLLDREVLRRLGGPLQAVLDARSGDVHARALPPRG